MYSFIGGVPFIEILSAMKYFPRVFFTALILLVTGCELVPAASDEGVERVDLTEGRRYVYEHDLVVQDSGGEVIEASAGRYAVRVAATGEAVGGMDGLTRLDATSGEVEGRTSAWYRDDGRRLVEVAYRGAGRTPVVMPKRQRTDRAPWQLPRLVERLLDESPLADTTIVRSDPRIVYRYPLVEGLEWMSFTDPFSSEREVVGIETVEVEAGTFRCAKIRTSISLDEDLVWYDYVAAEGLVLRTVESSGERRDASNTPLGTFTADERLELTTLE